MLPRLEALEKECAAHAAGQGDGGGGTSRVAQPRLSERARKSNNMKGSKSADFASRLELWRDQGQLHQFPVAQPHPLRSSMWIPWYQVRTSSMVCRMFGAFSLPLMVPLSGVVPHLMGLGAHLQQVTLPILMLQLPGLLPAPALRVVSPTASGVQGTS